MASIIAVPAFSDNYVWMLRNDAHAVIVDPGDAAPVLDRLASERVQLAAIFATHHHNDHVGGIPALRERFDVPVFGPAGETIPERTHALREGDAFEVAELRASFRVLDIPGHTRGHIAFTATIDGRPVVFCGDTLFAAGRGKLFDLKPELVDVALRQGVRPHLFEMLQCTSPAVLRANADRRTRAA